MMSLRPSLRLAATARRSVAAMQTRLFTDARMAKARKVTHPDIILSEDGTPSPTQPSQSLIDETAQYMVTTYSRPPVVFTKALGSLIWDAAGRWYIDFTGGIAVNSLGHNDKQLTQLMLDQANTLTHCSNLYYNQWVGELSKRLVLLTKQHGGMHDAAQVFVCNSGSEANEAGIKFARKVGKVLDPSGQKIEIVSFRNAFHGRTMGSLSATPNPKYQEPFSPMVPGFKVGDLNDIPSIPSLVTEKTCSVIVEPIQGEGGVTPATDEFLIALAARCREVGALLHYDEIQCGLGRTGQFWAHSHLPPSAHPDILTTAKALGNGFPIGATIINSHVGEKINVGDHGTTFGGNPLACRLACSIIDRLSDPELLADVKKKEGLFRKEFEEIAEEFPGLVKEVRGRGLILGVQLSEDPAPIVKAARERGLLVITAGTNTLRFVPALTIQEQQIKDGMGKLRRAVRVVKGGDQE
ncbi:pyridoxal phosphate-dependent transferase [Triangularia verruculosa]|uniref:acetylornithine transaminase n=1 Tax=Triangularia verruculosa TaxID=2587418 RepID=A0AAN6XG29_9PEZI|nr:pyridoxal phosphate-dependent transferase [Triangularia verruculosa]